MNTSPPTIAITMGDPAGVGPELCLRALTAPKVREVCRPIIIGDAQILNRCAHQLSLPKPEHVWELASWSQEGRHATSSGVLHIPAFTQDSFQPGQITAETGRASFAYIETAIALAKQAEIAAVTTGPISKEALALANIPFPGHTEIFATRTASDRWCMMQFAPEIVCTFVTVHVGYAEVPQLLSVERILEVIELTADAMRRLKGPDPVLVVCGLNPHAGEHGLFGNREEERLVIPAIAAAREQGIKVIGPLPADTAFIPERRRTTDAFVCLYHDQGHIPVKALAFDSAVNTTLGLPIVRTSVDHGTACDIAWTGQARPDSLYAALRLAAVLSNS